VGRHEGKDVLQRCTGRLLIGPFVRTIEKQQDSALVDGSVNERKKIGCERRLQNFGNHLLETGGPAKSRARAAPSRK
jgi:hypothetical protein